MPSRWSKIPLRELSTYGRPRAPRLADCDYAGDANVHVTICAATGRPFADEATAKMVCDSVEFCSRKLGYTLHGYCLMPGHLHVLLSPGKSAVPLVNCLRDFKVILRTATASGTGPSCGSSRRMITCAGQTRQPKRSWRTSRTTPSGRVWSSVGRSGRGRRCSSHYEASCGVYGRHGDRPLRDGRHGDRPLRLSE